MTYTNFYFRIQLATVCVVVMSTYGVQAQEFLLSKGPTSRTVQGELPISIRIIRTAMLSFSMPGPSLASIMKILKVLECANIDCFGQREWYKERDLFQHDGDSLRTSIIVNGTSRIGERADSCIVARPALGLMSDSIIVEFSVCSE